MKYVWNRLKEILPGYLVALLASLSFLPAVVYSVFSTWLFFHFHELLEASEVHNPRD